jgi:chitin disaccharide deacetylase
MRSLALTAMIVLLTLLVSCSRNSTAEKTMSEGNTWGEKLGYPADTRVLLLHADDAGMCDEANKSIEHYLANDLIQSTAVMMPCPSANDMLSWYKENPTKDIGMHLTLTSEWKEYRWAPVADADKVAGLIDNDGFMWHSVPQVVQNAKAEEVETEIRAQIDKALAFGVKPSHVDTHMGTLYGSLGFAQAYLKVAMEYNIPAMVIEFTDPIVERFRAQGYPITDEMLSFASEYTLPKLDDFYAAPDGGTYEEKKQNFYTLVRSLNPGITEIIFHPSIESENLKSITNSWQQRVWEAKMFADPEVLQFFKDENILFTNWKDMMTRFDERS